MNYIYYMDDATITLEEVIYFEIDNNKTKTFSFTFSTNKPDIITEDKVSMQILQDETYDVTNGTLSIGTNNTFTYTNTNYSSTNNDETFCFNIVYNDDSDPSNPIRIESNISIAIILIYKYNSTLTSHHDLITYVNYPKELILQKFDSDYYYYYCFYNATKDALETRFFTENSEVVIQNLNTDTVELLVTPYFNGTQIFELRAYRILMTDDNIQFNDELNLAYLKTLPDDRFQIISIHTNVIMEKENTSSQYIDYSTKHLVHKSNRLYDSAHKYFNQYLSFGFDKDGIDDNIQKSELLSKSLSCLVQSLKEYKYNQRSKEFIKIVASHSKKYTEYNEKLTNTLECL